MRRGREFQICGAKKQEARDLNDRLCRCCNYHKKLSCCREAARFFVSLNISLPVSHSRSLRFHICIPIVTVGLSRIISKVKRDIG